MSGGKDKNYDLDLMRALLDRYRVTSGASFDLDSFASDDLPDDVPSKHASVATLERGIEKLAALQELLYANATWSILIIIQAMDAAGKDSTIKHVMTGVNPQGITVTPFKAPGPHELAHDFLWRVHQAVPARGMIGIFNRSQYEDVLASRVHPDYLETAKLPGELIGTDRFWSERIADIAAFEAYLGRQGTKVLKFYLNVGLDEQKARFMDRLDEPDKTWKFSAADLKERAHWPDYRKAYQAAIAGTATKAAPWYIVPADRKWYMRLIVAETIIAALEELHLQSPKVTEDERERLASAREVLKRD